MLTSDVEAYLRSINNFMKLAHVPICEYCEHAYPVPGRACYCKLNHDLIFAKRSCQDISLDMRVLEDRKMLCRICANIAWKYNSEYKLYSFRCAKDAKPDSCIARHFEFKREGSGA